MKCGRNTYIAGVVFTLVGGALWGISGTSVQYLTTDGGAPPSLITLMRVIIGGSLFVAFLLLRDRSAFHRLISDHRSCVALLLFSLCLYLNQWCYAQTVQVTNAGTATVLQMLGSVFVMLFVCVSGHMLPRFREALGLVVAVVATVLIACQGDLGMLRIPFDGLMWGLLTGLSTALYIIVPKRFGLFERFGSVFVVGTGMFLGIIFAIPIYVLQGGSLEGASIVFGGFGVYEWVVFLGGLVLVGTMGGYGFYLHGVSLVGSVKGSLLGAIEPVSATVIAALWLKTAFSVYDIAGMILMCVMVGLVSSDNAPSQREHPTG